MATMMMIVVDEEDAEVPTYGEDSSITLKEYPPN
jgi:hypothetical protein